MPSPHQAFRSKHDGIFLKQDEPWLCRYTLPLSELGGDFYDELKSVSSGYASFDYEEAEYRFASNGRPAHLASLIADCLHESMTSAVMIAQQASHTFCVVLCCKIDFSLTSCRLEILAFPFPLLFPFFSPSFPPPPFPPPPPHPPPPPPPPLRAACSSLMCMYQHLFFNTTTLSLLHVCQQLVQASMYLLT